MVTRRTEKVNFVALYFAFFFINYFDWFNFLLLWTLNSCRLHDTRTRMNNVAQIYKKNIVPVTSSSRNVHKMRGDNAAIAVCIYVT